MENEGYTKVNIKYRNIPELNLSRLEEFYKIHEITGKRDGFIIRNMEYFKKMYELFTEENNLRCLEALTFWVKSATITEILFI